MEYQRTEKAYTVAHKDEINSLYWYRPDWPGARIYAENSTKARQKYFSSVDSDFNYKFIDIRAKRERGADRYAFEGESMVLGEIERINNYRKWHKDMAELLKNNAGAKVHIWSDEHGAYWRSNRCGYTTEKEQAGVYTIEDAWNAVSHVGIEKRISFQIIQSVSAVAQTCQ